MHTFIAGCQILVGLAICIGVVCWLAVLWCAPFFRSREISAGAGLETLPSVTLLKPVYGLEKHLEDNLRSACLQDYPQYQVIYSVQRADDPALPLLRLLEREFGNARVTVALAATEVGQNGKINNLAGAVSHARHDILVISDSDVFLRSDFLRQIVAPLADPTVGAVTAFFRGSNAGPWYEQMEQLTLNADQFAIAMLVSSTGWIDMCFGASIAFSRHTLAEIGGFEGLADFLVEDTEMGRRINAMGKKVVLIPYVVDTTIDLSSPAHWWQKQTYWDQNTRAAVPALFGATLVLRIIPLSLLFAALRGWDAVGLSIMCTALAVRLCAAMAVLGVALKDYGTLRHVWLLPIKDVLSMAWFVRALFARRVVWRGVEMKITRGGRLSPVSPKRALELRNSS